MRSFLRGPGLHPGDVRQPGGDPLETRARAPEEPVHRSQVPAGLFEMGSVRGSGAAAAGLLADPLCLSDVRRTYGNLGLAGVFENAVQVLLLEMT